MQAVHGARVRGLTPAECEVCAVTKAHRIISRRPTTRLTTLYKRVPFNEDIDIEPAPPYTKEHNGATERSWGGDFYTSSCSTNWVKITHQPVARDGKICGMLTL
jgi:hypothetical protein